MSNIYMTKQATHSTVRSCLRAMETKQDGWGDRSTGEALRC